MKRLAAENICGIAKSVKCMFEPQFCVTRAGAPTSTEGALMGEHRSLSWESAEGGQHGSEESWVQGLWERETEGVGSPEAAGEGGTSSRGQDCRKRRAPGGYCRAALGKRGVNSAEEQDWGGAKGG